MLNKQCIIAINTFGTVNYLLLWHVNFYVIFTIQSIKIELWWNLALGIYLSERGFFYFFCETKNIFLQMHFHQMNILAKIFSISLEYFVKLPDLEIFCNKQKNFAQKPYPENVQNTFWKILPNLIIYFMSRNILFETLMILYSTSSF